MSPETTSRRLLLISGALAAVGLTSLVLTFVASDEPQPSVAATTTTVVPASTTSVSLPPTTVATTVPPTTAAPTTTTTVAPTVPPIAADQVRVVNSDQQSIGLFDLESKKLEWVGPSAALPESAEYQTNGGMASLYIPDTGELWTGRSSELVGATFPDGATDDLPEGSKVVITGEGKVLVVSKDGWYELGSDPGEELPPSTGTASEETTAPPAIQPTGTDVAEDEPKKVPVPAQFDDDTQVTALGSTLVYLNSDGLLFTSDDDEVEIPGANAVLQQAGEGGDSVLVATSVGLFEVDLSSMVEEDVVQLAIVAGTPARPVRVNACIHAAWSGVQPTVQPTWFRSCEGRLLAVPLDAESIEGPLEFRVAGERVALNAVATGQVWVESGFRLPGAVDVWKVEQ